MPKRVNRDQVEIAFADLCDRFLKGFALSPGGLSANDIQKIAKGSNNTNRRVVTLLATLGLIERVGSQRGKWVLRQ